MRRLVFVYGTLLRGLSNHSVMDHSNGKFIGQDKIQGRMFCFTVGYPFITLKDPLNYTIHGEVYEVDHFHYLDRLEGYVEGSINNFYSRSIVKTKKGLNVCVYHIENYSESCNWIINGNWKEWKQLYFKGKSSNHTIENLQNTEFPLPKKGTNFYIQLLHYLSDNPMIRSVAVPTYAYRSIEYASEKTSIKVRRQFNNEYNCYLVSIPQGGTISKTWL